MQSAQVVRSVTKNVGLLAFAAIALLGCRNTLVLDECLVNEDCADSTICADGLCIEPPDEQSVSCDSDLDCNTNQGQVCDRGACIVPETTSGCLNTSECNIDQYCNSTTRTCAALQDGWCRQTDQCGVESPHCSAASPGVPGRCVQCLSDVDCGGGRCVQPGLCEGGAANPVGGEGGDCPANSTDVGGQCQCNNGFAPNPNGEGCIQVGADTGPCPQNASEASPGQCVCNPGFEPSADLSSCVATGQGDPTANPDPGTDPGTGGTGGFDLCESFGWYGDGMCDDFCPQPDPDCTAAPPPDPGPGTNPGTSPQCTIPEDCWAADINTTCETGSCVCDLTWMESQCGAQGVDAAACACGTGGGGSNPTNGLALNASCVVGGQVLECNTGLECIWSGDPDGMPAYGSCKQTCTSSAECPGALTCALGFLGSGDGICGTPLTDGQAGCGFWEEGDTFCFDPSVEVQDGAFLECINSQCDLVCDSTANTGAALTCPVAQTCGNFRSATGFTADIATCN
jgi:hypothetical protein